MHRDNFLAAVSGAGITIAKSCTEMTQGLNGAKILETFILGMVGAAGGFIFWQVIKLIKKLIKKITT